MSTEVLLVKRMRQSADYLVAPVRMTLLCLNKEMNLFGLRYRVMLALCFYVGLHVGLGLGALLGTGLKLRNECGELGHEQVLRNVSWQSVLLS